MARAINAGCQRQLLAWCPSRYLSIEIHTLLVMVRRWFETMVLLRFEKLIEVNCKIRSMEWLMLSSASAFERQLLSQSARDGLNGLFPDAIYMSVWHTKLWVRFRSYISNSLKSRLEPCWLWRSSLHCVRPSSQAHNIFNGSVTPNYSDTKYRARWLQAQRYLFLLSTLPLCLSQRHHEEPDIANQRYLAQQNLRSSRYRTLIEWGSQLFSVSKTSTMINTQFSIPVVLL